MDSGDPLLVVKKDRSTVVDVRDSSTAPRRRVKLNFLTGSLVKTSRCNYIVSTVSRRKSWRAVAAAAAKIFLSLKILGTPSEPANTKHEFN